MKNMKIRFILIALVITTFFACEKYEDYEIDTIGFECVYFPYQKLDRSAISGEGLKIEVGAVLAGVKSNPEDQSVKFVIDPSLLTGTTYTLLPSNYYTLSNPGEITIQKGKLLGMVTVKFDSLKLANDIKFLGLNYALPLKITESSADSIHGLKYFTVIPVKLINTWEGFYYQIGAQNELTTGAPIVTAYGDTMNLPKAPIRNLVSMMMDTVTVDGIGAYGGVGYSMKLKVNKNNSVQIFPVKTSKILVEQNGNCSWDPKKRGFRLKYKYSFSGKNYTVEDYFIFRNRIRDGINEWRWDGFPGN